MGVGVDEAGDDDLAGDIENVAPGRWRHVADRCDLVVGYEQVSLNEWFIRLKKVTALDEEIGHVLRTRFRESR